MNPYDEVREQCCPAGWQQKDLTTEMLDVAIQAHHNTFRGAAVAIFHEYFGFNGLKYTPEQIMRRLPCPPVYYPEQYSYILCRETIETILGTSVNFVRNKLEELLQAASHEQM